MKAKMDEILEVELFPGTALAQLIVCRLCNEVVYRVGQNPTKGEIDVEAKGLGAHLEFRHGIEFRLVHCEDPTCLEGHA